MLDSAVEVAIELGVTTPVGASRMPDEDAEVGSGSELEATVVVGTKSLVAGLLEFTTSELLATTELGTAPEVEETTVSEVEIVTVSDAEEATGPASRLLDRGVAVDV